MRTATEGKGLSVDQWCEILVDKATQRMEATDAFADWEKKSKGNRPLSDAERLRLSDLEKEVARLRKENALLKTAKPNNLNPSTSAAAVGNNGCCSVGRKGTVRIDARTTSLHRPSPHRLRQGQPAPNLLGRQARRSVSPSCCSTQWCRRLSRTLSRRPWLRLRRRPGSRDGAAWRSSLSFGSRAYRFRLRLWATVV